MLHLMEHIPALLTTVDFVECGLLLRHDITAPDIRSDGRRIKLQAKKQKTPQASLARLSFSIIVDGCSDAS